MHSCTAPQGPLCKHWPRERPTGRSQLESEDAAELEPAALWAVQQGFLFAWGHSLMRCCVAALYLICAATLGLRLPQEDFQRQGTADPPRDVVVHKVLVRSLSLLFV